MSKTKTQKEQTETGIAIELPLPYEEITETANRETLRSISKAGRSTYYIDIDIVTFRPEFNVREYSRTTDMTDEDWENALEIPELAQLILENGQEEPIEGDLLPGGTEFATTDGYRRTLAKRYLIRQGHTEDKKGKPLNQIEVIPNAKGTTEIDRITRMLSSDIGKLKFRPLEISHGLLRLKQHFGMSHEEIGDKFKRSRQWVDNMIMLAEFPENVRLAIEKGVISATAANTLARNLKDQPDKFNSIIDNAIQTGEKISVKDATAAVTPTQDTPPSTIAGKDNKVVTVSEVINQQPAGTINDPNKTETDNDGTGDDGNSGDDDDDKEPVKNPVQSINSGDTFQQEAEVRQTSARPTDRTPRNKTGDALDSVDFSKDKTEIDLELSEAIKLLDKIETKVGLFPDHLKQYKDDIIGLGIVVKKKLQNVQELAKKAPAKGEIE